MSKSVPKAAKTKYSAPKAPFSFRRHIMPPMFGILAMVAVLGALNGQWLVAQAQYRFVKSPEVSDVAINTAAQSPTPLISIPKIHVSAPIVFDEPSFEEWKVQIALRRGVLHYGSTVNPGKNGNVVIFGHSSGQLWAPGNYKFVFTLLDRLKKDDKIVIDYDGTRYIYKVTESFVVSPDDLKVLEDTKTPTLTLITCTPVGTSKNRLIVHADQISPKPVASDAEPNSETAAPVTTYELPSSATKSLWQTIRSIF